MTPTAHFCDQCGAALPVDSDFCEQCGGARPPAKGFTNFTQVRKLFDQALSIAPPLRESWLAEHCADDPVLLAELRGMLPREQDSFLGKAAEFPPSFIPPSSPSGTPPRPPSSPPPPVTPPSSQATANMIGPYRLVRELGRGGMGVVYLAMRDDGTFRKNVALKLLLKEQVTPEFVQRFKQERQVLATLDHPNIARILDGGDGPDGMPYYVMEYVEGLPVDRYCDEQRLSLSARIQTFRQICLAVHYLHQSSTVHRDLKPANILVSAGGTVKLLDFGIAKMLGAGAYVSADLTNVQGTPMTPNYASPEQIQGITLDKTSDIYSLGVILYLLLTGRPPYESWADKQAKLATRKDPPLPSANIREDLRATPENTAQLRKAMLGELDSIVLMALRFDPRDRYQSASELAEDLQRFLDGQSVAAHRESVARKSVRLIRRKRALIAVLACFLLLTGFGGWQWWRVQQQRAEIASREAQLRTLLDQLELGASVAKPDADRIKDLEKLRAAFAAELPAVAAAQPERAAQHQALLERSVRYLDRIAGAGSGSPRADLGIALADSYQQMALLQANVPTASKPVSRASALATYQKAADVLNACVVTPGDTRVATKLAQVRQRMRGMVTPAADAVQTPPSSGVTPAPTAPVVPAKGNSQQQATVDSRQPTDQVSDPAPISPAPANPSIASGLSASATAELHDRMVSAESRVTLAEQAAAPLQRSLEAKGQTLNSNALSALGTMRVRLNQAKRQIAAGDQEAALENLAAARALADQVLRQVGR